MNLTKLVKILAAFLLIDPLLRVLFFKLTTKLEFSLVWNNIVENSLSSTPMFLEYWVLAPLTGLLLLSTLKFGQHIYMLLTLFNFYSLMTYTPFHWPYFSKTPHWSAFILMSFSMGIVAVLYWPIVKKYILSRHFRHLWDARGRYPYELDATLFVDQKGFELSGQVKNISTGGLLLSLNIQSGLLTSLHDEGLIILKDDHKKFLALTFEVVNHRAANGEYLLGIEFKKVNSALRLRLLELLQRRPQKEKVTLSSFEQKSST